MNNELTLFEKDNVDKIVKAATMFAKSSIVPRHLCGKVEDIFAVIVMGNELGIPAMQSINSICMIQGRPCLSTQLMVALVRSKFKTCKITYKMDEVNKTVTCTVYRDFTPDNNEPDFVSTWNMEKVSAMGLAGRDQYKKQHMNMMKWRSTSEALRTVFPDALMGLMTTEEFKDVDGKEVTVVENLNDQLAEDFPQPENETTLGHEEYRIMYGTHGRGKKLGEMDIEALEAILVMIDKRAKSDAKIPDWHDSLYRSITIYLENIGE